MTSHVAVGQPRFPRRRSLPRSDLRALSALFRGTCGPVRLRVPEHRAEKRRNAGTFAARLDEFFSVLPVEGMYAVESRTEEFLTPDVLRGPARAWRRPCLQLLDPDARHRPPARSPGSLSAPFIVARALLRRGTTYDEAVDAFAPYDRIQDPNPELRRDLVRLIETAVHTRIPAYLLVNNRAEGSAPNTIAEVARLLPGACR